MKTICYLLVGAILIMQSCKGQSAPEREIFNEDFKWTITIPENFNQVSNEEWAKLLGKGKDAVEQTYETEIVNQAKTIFVFKSDQLNYFEANYQPFDVQVDGNYEQSNKDVNNLLYGTFAAQVPDVKLDTANTVETIDGLQFRVFKIDATYPNKMILHMRMFTRLFDKREFTVNISYVDKNKGNQMLDAWRKSRFAK